eukprot:TRINITY_DN9214_c0_g1_i2.p1 TRINITY_DN9214_c0_g1~~TRINITY_DN9214_c0_g1_i2.p1  ORF type:complete len:382 (-),score=85.61 TRINITY_DN9214_c0_g1_i2:677-1822(-)
MILARTRRLRIIKNLSNRHKLISRYPTNQLVTCFPMVNIPPIRSFSTGNSKYDDIEMEDDDDTFDFSQQKIDETVGKSNLNPEDFNNMDEYVRAYMKENFGEEYDEERQLDPELYYTFGVLHLVGKKKGYVSSSLPGIEDDPVKAEQYFDKAAELGHKPSIYNLGNIYSNRGEHQKAFDAYMRAVSGDEPFPDACHNLGHWYLNHSSEPDIEKALYWYEKGANLGISDSATVLSNYYLQEKNDLKEAEKWMRKAAEGSDEGKMSLALHLFNFDPKNPEIYDNLKILADKGDTDAMLYLAKWHEGYNQIADAKVLYKQCSDKGDARGTLSLGDIYCNTNFQKAYKLYKKSADSGLPEAHYRLCELYFVGMCLSKLIHIHQTN